MEKALLPYLYWIWSDGYLTERELQLVNDFLNRHPSVKDKLEDGLRYLDKNRPPSRTVLHDWKRQLSLALAQSDSFTSLTALSLYLSQSDPEWVMLQPELEELESQLGIYAAGVFADLSAQQESFTAQQETLSNNNVSYLRQWLSGEHQPLEDELFQVLLGKEFQYVSTAYNSAYRETILKWCRILAQKNYGNTAYPKAYRGQDDLGAYFKIMETLSYHDLSLVIKFGVQFGLWGMSVFFLGTETQHAKWLKKIGTMEIPGCFAMTETGHGSNVKGLETTATYDPSTQNFIIHTPHPRAQKEYIGNAALHGQMATVFAKLIIEGIDYGINAFVVPIRDESGNCMPGIEIWDCGPKMGLNGVDNGRISFDQVVIPKDHMLDRFASVDTDGKFQSPISSDNRRFFTMLGTLVGGRIGIPRSAVSALKKGISIAIRYSDTRRQFGPDPQWEEPILNYRMHQRRLFPHLARSYAYHFALGDLTDRFLNRTPETLQEIETLAAGMKAYITWAVRDGLQECREAMGGKGYLWENRISDLKNDTEIYTTFEGDNTVLMQLVAKNRLGWLKKNWADKNWQDKLDFAVSYAKNAVLDKNPIATRRTETSHLTDLEFHLQTLRSRETDLLQSAAKRIQKLMENNLSAYDAFNVVQHHLIDVATAHIDREILESFQSHLSFFKGSIPIAVEMLYQIFALDLLDKHKAWYLEYGYMDGVKTKAIRKLLNQYCWDVRPHAVDLTRAFGIPDGLIGAEVLTAK